MTNKNIFISVIIAALLIVVAGAGATFLSSGNNNANSTSTTSILATTTSTGASTSTFVVATGTTSEVLIPMDVFAKCVAKADFTMYGAVWCPHCQNQKKEFGDSFKYVSYVECPDNIKLCEDKGIVGFPTWLDKNGKKYEGEQSLSNIASITGCALPAGK